MDDPRRVREPHRLRRHGLGSADDGRSRQRAPVASVDDLRIAPPRVRRSRHLGPPRRRHRRPPAGGRDHGPALVPPGSCVAPDARAAGGRRRALNHRFDLVEGHREHVVRDERQRSAGGSASMMTRSAIPTESTRSPSSSSSTPASGPTTGSGTRGRTAPRGASFGAGAFQANADHDGRSATLRGSRRPSPRRRLARPRLPHGVVGLPERSEHPVGDRPEPDPVLLEPLGQRLGGVPSVTASRRGVSSNDPSTGGRCDRAASRRPEGGWDDGAPEGEGRERQGG